VVIGRPELVQDASYIVTVPNMLALTNITIKQPKICYMYDKFKKPYPFQSDVVVSIDDVIEKKIDMLHCHVSQMYEWLPFNQGILDQVPVGGKKDESGLWNGVYLTSKISQTNTGKS